MTELEAAEGIRDGRLQSPTKLGGMWLWAMRITGTGASFRPQHDEFVWRPSEHYLNDEFLARCNGLPVVWEHPSDKAKLDSEEFGKRVVGSIMLPYIKDQDVFGIARVYDTEANELMQEKQFSTSPGVVFMAGDGNQTVEITDDYHLLVEGKPSLLDHLAIVPNGVWDRGGDPTGVLTTALQQGVGMTEEEKAAAARDDAAKLDKALAALDAMSRRFDAMEAEKADRARKDAEEAEAKAAAEKEREDKARKDAEETERKDAQARRDAARKDRFGARKDGESDEDFGKRMDADEEAERKDAEEEGCEPAMAADRAKKSRK